MSNEIVTVKGKGLARVIGESEDKKTIFVRLFSNLNKSVQVKANEIEPYRSEQ